MEAGRLNAHKAAPDAMRAVQRVEAYIQQCGLEKSLIELVKMRASQINGCAYCLHVHRMSRTSSSLTSPLGWEHVNLTGDYIWSAEPPATENSDGFRPLRTAPDAARKAA
jgi:AhpD family alkylhydroperoxidase